MKRLTLLALLLFAAPLWAADHVLSFTPVQEARAERIRVKTNKATCKNFDLPGTCTQAAVRTAFCVRAGFGPVTSCDGAAQFKIHADVDGLLNNGSIPTLFAAWKAELDAEDKADFLAWLDNATQAEKDAQCAQAGKQAGCYP